MDALPQILVTGASGFIASHIIHQLLTAGQVKVRGTVRSLKNEAKVTPLYSLVPSSTYPLELVEADLLNEDSWNEAVKGCTHVYHVASPLPSSTPRDEDEVLRPAVEGTLNVLKACHQSGTVKRVVLTSSLGAISAGLYGEEREYNEGDWSSEQICPPYEKSKLLAEIAAWDFVEKIEENRFELVAIHPSVVIGPPLTVASGEATALATVKKLIANEIPVLLHLNLPLVDVRDVATAHILVMENPLAAGNRYIITAENRWLKDIAFIISEEFRPQGYKVPKWVVPKPGVWLLSFLDTTVRLVYPIVGKEIRYNNEKMRSELGLQTRDVNSTILDCCYALIELGIVPKERNYHGPADIKMSSPQHQTIINTQDKEEQPTEPIINEEEHSTVLTKHKEEQPKIPITNEHHAVLTEDKEQPTVPITNEEEHHAVLTDDKTEDYPTLVATIEGKELIPVDPLTTENNKDEILLNVTTIDDEKEEQQVETMENKEE